MAKGVLDGMKDKWQKIESTPVPAEEDKEVKRGYMLPLSAVKKLQEIKLLDKDENITYNTIVTRAICLLHAEVKAAQERAKSMGK